MRGTGRAVFVATLLVIIGTVNIIYGIGALDDANVFVNDKRLVFDNLNTLGWVTIILGVVQLTAGFSLFAVPTHAGILAFGIERRGLLRADPGRDRSELGGRLVGPRFERACRGGPGLGGRGRGRKSDRRRNCGHCACQRPPRNSHDSP